MACVKVIETVAWLHNLCIYTILLDKYCYYLPCSTFITAAVLVLEAPWCFSTAFACLFHCTMSAQAKALAAKLRVELLLAELAAAEVALAVDA
jgi:hypothetical protein